MGRKIVKPSECKLIDASGAAITSFKPGCSLIYEGKQIPLDKSYGGIIVSTDDSNLIVDDGFINKLYKAGYVVYKNYDKERSDFTSQFTNEMYTKFINALYEAADESPTHAPCWGPVDEIYLENEFDKITFRINRVTDIVEMNKKRKDNALTFYPFNKDMDRNATLYLSVFYKRKKEGASYSASRINYIIKKALFKLGSDYHFSSMPVRGIIAKWDGI